MLSRLVIYFSSKEEASFNFKAAVTICRYFGAQKNKVSYCFHCFSIYLQWSDGTRCYLSLLNVEFKPTFSLFSFTFIKMLFSFSSLSAIRAVSYAYLRLLIFFPAILISACASPAQHFSWCTLNTRCSKSINWTFFWKVLLGSGCESLIPVTISALFA